MNHLGEMVLISHRSEEYWWGWPARIQRGWTGSSQVASSTATCHMGSVLTKYVVRTWTLRNMMM